MVDLDCSIFIEYDDGTKEPLALIETARDVGQPYKPATVTLALAAAGRRVARAHPRKVGIGTGTDPALAGSTD